MLKFILFSNKNCSISTKLVIIWMVVLFWREMKEAYIDLLRVIQYILIFLRYCYSIFAISSLFWITSNYNTTLDIIFAAFQSSIIYYCLTNLITWYLLMNHIEAMSQLRNGKQLSKMKEKIMRKEIILSISWTIIIWFGILFDMFLPILSNLNPAIYEKSDLIDTVELISLYLALLIFWFILFMKLSKILKNNLNYYFINNWKRIRFIFIISFALFIWTIILN